MEPDLTKRCVLLEGFPSTAQPEVNISSFLVRELGVTVPPQHIRVLSTTHLTTSNTPNWVLLCSSELDAQTICNGHINYPFTDPPSVLRGRPCCMDEVPSDWKMPGPTSNESMMSVRKDSMMSVARNSMMSVAKESMVSVDVTHPDTDVPGEGMMDSMSVCNDGGQTGQFMSNSQDNETNVHPMQGFQQSTTTGQWCQSNLYPSQFYPQHPPNAPFTRPTMKYPIYPYIQMSQEALAPQMPVFHYQGQQFLIPCQANLSAPGFPSTSINRLPMSDMRIPQPRRVPSPLMYAQSESPGLVTDNSHLMTRSQLPYVRSDTVHTDNEFKTSSHSMEHTIEVHGCNLRQGGPDRYRFFFENSRRGGGEIKKFQVTEDNVLLITFEDPSVVQRLIQEGRKTIGETDVTIKDHVPLPLYKHRVLLEYPDAHLDKTSEDLCHYIEARSQNELVKRETGNKADLIMVEFVDPVDAQRLQSACSAKPFRGNTVRVRDVPATSILHIRGTPESMSTDTIQDYFETKKCGNDTNTEVIKVEALEDHGSFLVYFADFRAISKIIQKQHTLGGCPTEVCLYHRCIGLTSWEIDPQPKAKTLKEQYMVLDKVNPLIGRFLKKFPLLLSQINGKAREENLVVSINTDNKLCVKRIHVPESYDAKWEKAMLETCMSILNETVAHHTLSVPVEFKDKVESVITHVEFDPDEVKCYTDKSTIAVIGTPNKAESLRRELEGLLLVTEVTGKPIVATMEGTAKVKHLSVHPDTREIEKQEKAVVKVKALERCLLSVMNFEVDVRKSNPGVNVNINTDEVVFEGPEDKVTNATIQVHETVNSFEVVELENISEQQVALLQKTAVRNEVSTRLKRKNITAAWNTKQFSVEVIARSKSEAREAVDVILVSVVERLFPLENSMLPLLNTDSWEKFQKHLMDVFPDKFSLTNLQDKKSLLVVGLPDDVDSIYEAVADFLKSNEVGKTVVSFQRGVCKFIKNHFGKEVERISKDLKTNNVQITYQMNGSGFVVQGSSEGIKEGKSRLEILAGKVIRHNEVLKKAGLAKMLASHDGLRMINHVEQVGRCAVEVGNEPKHEVTIGERATERAQTAAIVVLTNLTGGRKIYVRRGDITSLRVEAIVNAANTQLDHCGGLAKDIVEEGGNTIQEDCKRHVMSYGEIMVGDAVASDPGRLPCDVLIHAVGPQWEGGNKAERDHLTVAVWRSMELAEKNKCRSIAIPGLSTGIFGYPTDEATKVITTAVRDYFRDNRESIITDVYLCDNAEKTIDGFTKAMKNVFGVCNLQQQLHQKEINPGQTSTRHSHRGGPEILAHERHQIPDRPPYTEHPKGNNINLVMGKIAQQKVNVIVNSTNKELSLKDAGAVSKSLLEAAGPELQSACKRGHPNGINPGAVAVTRGFKLQCNSMYHICLPQYSKEDTAKKDVRDIVMKCLTTGSMNGITSMAFPALGTGSLKYPREMVAKCMFTTIQEFWKQKPDSSLKDVRIILYDEDKPTITAFEKVKAKNGKLDMSSQQPTRHRRSHRKVDMVLGSITRFQADVLVNATDWDLVVDRGQLSKSIAEAAGPGLKKECTTKYPKGVPVGGLAKTSGCRLKAKQIYHVVVPKFERGKGKEPLSDAVNCCLEEAHRSSYNSLLFPTLGVGIPGYDRAMSAATMLETIDAFWTNHPGTSLTEIKIVIYDQAHDTAKAFEQEKSRFYGSNSSVRKGRQFRSPSETFEEATFDLSGGVTFGNIHFSIKHGDLLQEQADCIISSVHPSFDLSLGMVNRTILKKFGDSAMSKNRQKVAELSVKGLTVTPVQNAPFSMIIHFDINLKGEWNKIFTSCIKEADKRNCSSVALPALSQGEFRTLSEDIFLEYLYDSLMELSKLKNVTNVNLVILDKVMHDRFRAKFEELLSKKGMKPKNWFRKMFPKEKSKGMTRHQQHTTGSHTRTVSTHTPDDGIEVCFYSDTKENIDAAKMKLLDAYQKEFGDEQVSHDTVKSLDEAKLQRLCDEGKERGVVITEQKRLGKLRVQGIKTDVATMIPRIYEILLEHKDEESAHVLGSVVQWYFQEVEETGDERLVSYDESENIKIEKAYRDDEKTCVLEDTDGVRYIVDFTEMVEYIENDQSSGCPVIRKDLIEAAEFDPPPNWERMGPKENQKVVILNQDSQEYRKVTTMFASANKQIVKIERIQNKTLYKQYQAKKQSFLQRLPHHKCEKELWHGTATNAIPSINKEGFNRSYCGKNAVAYGNGVYFAVNSQYSIQDKYSKPDISGNKYIYLVDVLTGEYTQGKQGMRVPPPIDPAVPSVLYDSVVENAQTPTMFVIFNDTQAYPKYLITFK